MSIRRSLLKSDQDRFEKWQRELEYAQKFKSRKLDRAVRTLIREATVR